MPPERHPDELPADLEAIAERLATERPRPSAPLQRRVRDVVSVAVREGALRRRSTLLFLSGTAFLVVAAVLALAAGR
ncbi:MAG: hypothetical protein WC558_05060 [Patulibacter sp.]